MMNEAISLSIFWFAGYRQPGLYAQLVDKTPAPIPNVPTVYNAEPWENPLVDAVLTAMLHGLPRIHTVILKMHWRTTGKNRAGCYL
jgi:hypothetical protein